MTTIHRGDLLAYLRGHEWLVQNGYIPKAHAVLSDPPYGLAFMNSKWDDMGPHEYQQWVTEWGRLMLSYVYPGAVLAAFGGTRTYHRLAAGLEDAGWIVFDCCMWTYASGFPKSHSISKAIDREAGAEREVVGKRTNGNRGGGAKTFDDDAFEWPKEFQVTAPATDAARQWDGYGTALSPSYEPIVLARAPFPGTYAQTAQQYGTAALNIEGSRIPTEESTARSGGAKGNGNLYGSSQTYISNESTLGRWPKNLILGCACESDDHDAGCAVRVLGGQSGESVSSGGNGSGFGAKGQTAMFQASGKAIVKDGPHGLGLGDKGTAARFYYTAKAAAWERAAGLHARPAVTVNDGRQTPIDNPYQRGETKRRNVHPTVKPIQLTEYIARLLLPPTLSEPRRLLVPFSGSGSEMIGAMLAGWDDVVGFEQSDDYADLADARIAWWAQFSDYDQAKRAYDADRAEQQQRDDEAAAGVRQLTLLDALEKQGHDKQGLAEDVETVKRVAQELGGLVVTRLREAG